MLARLTAVGASVAAITLVAWPAQALSSYAVNQTGCNTVGTGAQLQADTHIKNDDQGSTDVILAGSDAKLLLYNCSTRKPVTANLELDWTITAYGYSISCGVGVPASFSCGGSSTARTYTTSTSARSSVLTRSIASSGAVNFKDGSLGDTTKVCSVVQGWVNNSLVLKASTCAPA